MRAPRQSNNPTISSKPPNKNGSLGQGESPSWTCRRPTTIASPCLRMGFVIVVPALASGIHSGDPVGLFCELDVTVTEHHVGSPTVSETRPIDWVSTGNFELVGSHPAGVRFADVAN